MIGRKIFCKRVESTSEFPQNNKRNRHQRDEHAPFEVHPPVHEAVEVLGDEAVVHGGVVDGVDYGRNDQLEFVKKYISIK